MEQLTELDNAFVQMESNRTPLHITPVIFYDQPGATGGRERFKDILQVFASNLHKSKIFRRKLGGASLGFDAPYWLEDPDFDLEFHVRHIALPKPGNWRQLCILLSRLHSRGLDMSRPLWEAYVIEGLNQVEGLAHNSFAILLKVHHSAIDGVSGAEIVTALHTLEPDAPQTEASDDWVGEAEPMALKVWSRAYINNLKRPLRLVSTVRQLVPNILEAKHIIDERGKDDEPYLKKTRFNARVSPHRVTDTLVLELPRLKKIREVVSGATINDLILSVVGGALRKYLEAKDELPATSLTCGVPINVRRERDSDASGNQVGFMITELATDIADPLVRLEAVMRHGAQAKETSSVVGTGVMMDISKSLWPQFMKVGMRAATFAGSHSDIPMSAHTVISNVAGPQVPLYLAGAKAQMMMGMGPLLDLAGLFHAVFSSNGLITINFVSCRELLPDPYFYRQCLQESWDELERTALKQAKVRRRRPKKA